MSGRWTVDLRRDLRLRHSDPVTDAPSTDRTTDQPRRKKVAPALGAFVVLVLAIAIGVMQLGTPGPAPADAPADQFSAGRAMKTVTAVAGNGIPHPGGSDDLRRVREHLVAEITALGYSPELQSGNQTAQWFSEGKAPPINAAQITSPLTTTAVTNIVVRVPGTDATSTQAVIVDAHYDSVAPGPGASDDGGAVAAMVEVLRALKSIPPLRHDVIFLFTDAEESVLGGSTLFVTENPAAKDVRYILNFEYRGTTGKSLFFEGAGVNEDLLDAYRAAQAAPLASSLFYFAYQQLENSTDFSVLNTLNAPGLAFASIGNNVRYHTPTDDLVNFSPGALQYTGEMMLGLVTSIANQQTLNSKPGEELVWFTVGPVLVSYPTAVAFALLGVALVLLVLAFVFAIRRSLVTGRGLGRGFGTVLLAGVLSIVIAQALLSLIYFLRWDTRAFISLDGQFDTDPYRGQLYMVTIVVAVAAVTVAMLLRARKRQSVASLQLGALLLWALLATFATVVATPAAYLFGIPLLLMSAAALVRVLVKNELVVMTVDLILSFVFVVFLFPLAALVYQGLNLSTGWLVAFIVALSICILLPAIDLIAQAVGQWFSLALAATAVVLLVVGVATPLVNANHPQPDSLVYAIDANTGKAQWLSNDKAPDSWTENVLGNTPASGPAPEFMIMYFPVKEKSYETATLLSNPARATVAVPAPTLAVQSDRSVNGQRVVRFNVASARNALNLWYTMSTNGQLKALSVDGKKVPVKPADSWSILGQGLPATGYTAEVTLTAGSTFDVVVTDQTNSFPTDPALGLPPRPDTTFSWWPRGKQADATLVTKSFSLS